jgi:hypothetical protein
MSYTSTNLEFDCLGTVEQAFAPLKTYRATLCTPCVMRKLKLPYLNGLNLLALVNSSTSDTQCSGFQRTVSENPAFVF